MATATETMIEQQGGWSKIASNLDYWDSSAAVIMLYPEVIEKKYYQQPVCVNLKEPAPLLTQEKQERYFSFAPTDFSFYGSLLIDIQNNKNEHTACHYVSSESAMVDIVMDMNKKKFEQYFLAGFKKTS